MNIAILLATYNSGCHLRELLDSLLAQTYQNFICYVHDDGSIDSTNEILKEYEHNYKDKFLVLNYPPTGSSKANFMSMLHYVEEPYVMFCDQDDIWLNNKIELSLQKIKEIEKKNPSKAVLVFSDLIVVDNRLKVISKSFMKYTGLNPKNVSINHLLVENVVAGCTIIMNKRLCIATRRLNDYSNIMMHDLWCALVAAAIGVIGYINEPLILYRQHNHNVKGAEAELSLFMRVLIILKQIMKGNLVCSNKNWHKLFRIQAEELLKLPELPKSTRDLCFKFAHVYSLSKIGRIRFYVKNNIRREKRNFWLLLWC